MAAPAETMEAWVVQAAEEAAAKSLGEGMRVVVGSKAVTRAVAVRVVVSKVVVDWEATMAGW